MRSMWSVAGAMNIIRPTNAQTPEAKERMQITPHKYLRESAKMGASSCSEMAFARARMKPNQDCFWCGLKMRAEVHV